MKITDCSTIHAPNLLATKTESETPGSKKKQSDPTITIALALAIPNSCTNFPGPVSRDLLQAGWVVFTYRPVVFAFEIIASFVLPEVVQRINAVALGIQSSEAVAVAVDFVAAYLLQ